MATDEQIARVVWILETYGNGSECGVFRVGDVKACRAVAKQLKTKSVAKALRAMQEASRKRFLSAIGYGP